MYCQIFLTQVLYRLHDMMYSTTVINASRFTDAYFVKVSTFSNLKIDPQCLSSQLSACPCYPSNCSACEPLIVSQIGYNFNMLLNVDPTAPPPLTTKSSATGFPTQIGVCLQFECCSLHFLGTKLITTTTCNPANQNCLPTVVICNEGDKSGCQASIKGICSAFQQLPQKHTYTTTTIHLLFIRFKLHKMASHCWNLGWSCGYSCVCCHRASSMEVGLMHYTQLTLQFISFPCKAS